MYEKFYGLTEKPFSLLPDPAFLFLGKKHSMAFAMLEYSLLSQAGFTVITGEVGSGKTTLIRHLLNQLEDDVSVGLVSSSHRDMGDLLPWVLLSFGLDYREKEKIALHDAFTQFLIDQYARNKRTVLIIDEAQNLQVPVLEELRLLSNINADKHQVLQIILVGQPQLRELLQQSDLLQFQQRISVDYHLPALSEEETRAYIFHRTKQAGRSKPLFTRSASTIIHQASQGIPRVINILCETALVYGFADQKLLLDSELVESVIKDKAIAGARGPEIARVASTPQPALSAGGPALAGQSGNWEKAANHNPRRITDFDRDAAKLLFKKYYSDK
ncbi:MAG: AAA family ATPase [Candidatus Thiodiazotropha sp. (ex Dulcina madagascariensis)]|nr:AAA family ATPase [Candidatus Thiodiazotropha sp. (ex Dulcina madagascariensis)]